MSKAYCFYYRENFISFLKKYASDNDCKPQEPFPFFNLPDLVIQKILKEYVPVSDKAGALSQIPEFAPYLIRKCLWFPSTLKFYHHVDSLKTGWYVNSHDLDYQFYVCVNYFDFTVTVYHFNIKYRHTHVIRIDKTKIEKCRRTSSLQRFQDTLISVKRDDFLVYPFKCSPVDTYFWFFRPQNVVYTSCSSKVYVFKNNQCLLVNPSFHSGTVNFTFKEDSTAILKCQDHKDLENDSCPMNFGKLLSPLSFELCTEMGSDDRPSKCTSCTKGPSCVHPVLKETFTNFDENRVSIVRTSYR